MGFLFPKAPKPIPPANPAMPAPTNNPFADPSRGAGSFISGIGSGLTTKRKSSSAATSMIGGG